MKKLFSFLMIMLVSTSIMFADGQFGNPVRFWTDPAIFNYDEEVTWYYDLSDSNIPEGASIAIWSWEPAQTVGSYGNAPGETVADIDQASLLTYAGDHVWKLTFTPTELYGVGVDAFLANGEDGFWQLLRVFGADGVYLENTGVLCILYPHKILKRTQALALAETVPVESTVYPAAINATTPIAFILNNDEVDADVPVSLHLVSGLNGWTHKVDYDWSDKDASKAIHYYGYDDIYVFNVVNPSTYYGIPYDFAITDIQYLFTNFDWQPSPGPIFETEFENDYARPWQETTTGIKTIVTSKGVKASVIDNVLSVNAPAFEIYNIAGIRIAQSTESTLNVASLAKGVYVVKTANGSVKIVR
jgi:hypothetical protein